MLVDFLFFSFLNYLRDYGNYPCIITIYLTASHMWPLFPLAGCVLHHDQQLLYVSKPSPWGWIYKLSHNRWTVSCLTNCGRDTESSSVWWQISHCVDVIPSGLAPNLSPRGEFDLSNCCTQTHGSVFLYISLSAVSKPIHPPPSTVHFSSFIPFLHTDTFVFYSFFSYRLKWVFVHECLPVQWALREHRRELYLSETDHLSLGIPDQQRHLWRYTTPY